jgi:hypothetical protein
MAGEAQIEIQWICALTAASRLGTNPVLSSIKCNNVSTRWANVRRTEGSMARLPNPTPVPAGPMSALPSRNFSEHAEAKMWDLLKDSDNQVGRIYGGDHQGKTWTDCITYVMNVLMFAFEQTGQPEKAAKVRENAHEGMKLAKYLTAIGWKAYFWTPDSRLPRDGLSEHIVAYKKAATDNSYYTVPLSGLIVDYNLTPIPDQGLIDRLLHGTKPSRVPNFARFEKLSKVKFACVMAKGGRHNVMLSYGMIFQVHYEKIGAGLYERSPFYSWDWLSGIVVLPPDSGLSL